MNILAHFSKKQSLFACIAGATAIVAISIAAGFITRQTTHPPVVASGTQQQPIEIIDLAKATEMNKTGTLFIDARSPADYTDSHIPGAVNLDFYDFDKAFGSFSAAHAGSTPVVIYCNGITGANDEDTCETSRLLADKLFDRGYARIMIFEQGYAFWLKTGAPIEKSTDAATIKPTPKKMTPWAYTRDLSMLVLGILALLYIRKRPLIIAAQVILGLVFIISGSGKVLHPDKLQVIIDAYHIMPKSITPFMAMVLPWCELLCGITLVTGLFPTAGALVGSGMNIAFIPSLAYRAVAMARESGLPFMKIDFDCGCGLGENFAWVLILRDVGYLMIGVAVLVSLVRIDMQKRS